MAKVTMLQIGSKPEILQEFDLDHAQRILEVKHPQKTWEVKDSSYKMEKGKIVQASQTPLIPKQ